MFIDQMGINDYINYCGKASVLLDPLYFGAGNSFHESMYNGTPTITMPTDNIKSRIVLGAYNQMKIKDLLDTCTSTSTSTSAVRYSTVLATVLIRCQYS